MKALSIIALLLITTLVLKSQTWSYEQGGNAFDGKYKTSKVLGKGNGFPYNSPLFVINVFRGDIDNPNIYLSKVPCACCDHLGIMVKFDEDENIYNLKATTNAKQDAWFLTIPAELNVQFDKVRRKYMYWNERFETWMDYDSTKNVKPLKQFLEDIKTHSKMYVRLLSDCEKYDCEFSLSGSTAAINFILKK